MAATKLRVSPWSANRLPVAVQPGEYDDAGLQAEAVRAARVPFFKGLEQGLEGMGRFLLQQYAQPQIGFNTINEEDFEDQTPLMPIMGVPPEIIVAMAKQNADAEAERQRTAVYKASIQQEAAIEQAKLNQDAAKAAGQARMFEAQLEQDEAQSIRSEAGLNSRFSTEQNSVDRRFDATMDQNKEFHDDSMANERARIGIAQSQLAAQREENALRQQERAEARMLQAFGMGLDYLGYRNEKRRIDSSIAAAKTQEESAELERQKRELELQALRDGMEANGSPLQQSIYQQIMRPYSERTFTDGLGNSITEPMIDEFVTTAGSQITQLINQVPTGQDSRSNKAATNLIITSALAKSPNAQIPVGVENIEAIQATGIIVDKGVQDHGVLYIAEDGKTHIKKSTVVPPPGGLTPPPLDGSPINTTGGASSRPSAEEAWQDYAEKNGIDTSEKPPDPRIGFGAPSYTGRNVVLTDESGKPTTYVDDRGTQYKLADEGRYWKPGVIGGREKVPLPAPIAELIKNQEKAKAAHVAKEQELIAEIDAFINTDRNKLTSADDAKIEQLQRRTRELIVDYEEAERQFDRLREYGRDFSMWGD